MPVKKWYSIIYLMSKSFISQYSDLKYLYAYISYKSPFLLCPPFKLTFIIYWKIIAENFLMNWLKFTVILENRDYH